jgi:uncharacterized protein involved in type VI secretion and phage assembly
MLENVIANMAQHIEGCFYAKYRGIVVDNADPEQLGRLKVRVPNLLGPNVVTGWAMPCVPYGGDMNQGFFFIPEVGAGVWVEFEQGNLEYPIWVGTFWSKPGGDNEVPKPNDSEGVEQGSVQEPPTRKIIKTVKGHTLQFEDADGAESITIVEAVNQHVIIMNQEGIQIIDGANSNEVVMDSNGIVVTDANGNTATMDASGTKIEDANGNRMVMESAGVTIESATDVNIKGVNITIEAQAKFALTGNPIHLNP